MQTYISYVADTIPFVIEAKRGISHDFRFESDLNKTFTFYTGIKLERRNSFTDIGPLYDTTSALKPLYSPYRITYNSSYYYIGFPFGLSINYFNNHKLRIYQGFGLNTSFKFLVKKTGSTYYPDNFQNDFNNTEKFKFENIQDMITSLSSSIGISRTLSEKLEIKIETGFLYMINRPEEEDFRDFKIGIGMVYIL